MSLPSDNYTALLHLRDQARKWKNIAFVTIIAALLIITKISLSSPDAANDGEALNQSSSDYIASINVEGIIFSDNYRSKIIKKISEQKNIKAVIVNINSPGGGIVGSENLYNEIRKLSKAKPTVIVMDEVAASGGYMASLASDHIIARHGTLTGSIGVILQSAEITEMASKLGVKLQNYKSSHLKATPSPFEKSDAIVDQAINESIADSYKFFKDLVIERRKNKISAANLEKVLDGRIFTGNQALSYGLIDEIGGQDEALAYLQKQFKVSKDLEIKEVSVKKNDNKLIDKILNSSSSVKEFLSSNFASKKLMAIW